MKPVVFHAEAEAELEAGVAFYETRQRGLGLAFQDEVERSVFSIRGSPERWPADPMTGLRRCPLVRFPYRLFYLDLDEIIWIAAVAHVKRRPGYWAGRDFLD